MTNPRFKKNCPGCKIELNEKNTDYIGEMPGINGCEYPLVNCQACKTTALILPKNMLECGMCEGTGIVDGYLDPPGKPAKVKCPLCKGQG